MFKWFARMRAKAKGKLFAEKHLSKAQKREYRANTIRCTGKLIWTHEMRVAHLDRRAAAILGSDSIVAAGDITYREIPNTSFAAYYRTYYTKQN